MKIFLISSLAVLLSACSMNVGTTPTNTGSVSETPKTDTIAQVSPTTVGQNTMVTLNYTLRKDAKDGQIVETTLENVAKENTLYKEGMKYQPFQVMIGSNSVIPGFEQGLIGMKKGEKKVIEVPPELGYGTGARIETIPKSGIAPVFSITQDKKFFQDSVTQTIPKENLKDEMKKATVGQVFTGSENVTAKVTEVTESGITLEIDNIKNPFYKKKLAVGTSVDLPDSTYKITKIAGTGVTLEITNKQSPFYNKKFAVGESLESAQGKVIIQEINEDTIVIAQEHPFMGKTLFFDVEVTDIQ
jgi:FKBP-type peptidyl-prolyl cis-trans isomerase 2